MGKHQGQFQRPQRRWFIFITLAVMLCARPGSSYDTCTKINACSCQSEDGIIDLSPLDSKDPNNPRFKDIPAPGGLMLDNAYSYNPCTPFDEVYCVDSAVCRTTPSVGASVSLGSHKFAEFLVDPSTKQLQLKLPDDTQYYTSLISLTCDPNTEGELVPPPQDTDPPLYPFTLTTKYACVGGGETGGGGGLSTGSILCIVLLGLVVMYLGGGAIYMNKARDAKGVEMIPNLEFWKELPSLVKDGGKFMLTGCKTKLAYEEM